MPAESRDAPSTFADVDEPAAPPQTGLPPLKGAPGSERLVVLAAIAIGVLGDQLVRADRPGLGLTLLLVLVVGLVFGIDGRRGHALASSRRRWILLLALAGAIMISVRESDTVATVIVLVLATSVLLLSYRVAGRSVRDMRLGEFLLDAAMLLIVPAFRALATIVRAARAALLPAAGGRNGHGRDIALGLAIAIPVLAVFATLLAVADEGFKRLLDSVLVLDVTELVSHLALIAAIVVLVVTTVVAVFDTETEAFHGTPRRWIGPAVTWIVLGSTALLFMLFLGLQARYLFGGTAYLEAQSGLTAAEYARQGFFELATVALLVIPVLAAAKAWHDDTHASVRATRVMAPLLAAITLVLVGSAFTRLWLYQDRFGLSEARIQAAAQLVWIGAALVWIALRIARQRESLQLPWFGATAGIVVSLLLMAANPDALIARTNIDRSGDEQTLDPDYLASLSADATPVIVDRFDELPRDAKRIVAQSLLRQDDDRDERDWRSFTVASWRAERAVDAHRDELEQAAQDR